MKCRGIEIREKIASKYNIKAVAHVQLLAGQEKISCTNIVLTDTYYCFSYKEKKGDKKGTFLCGSHAATHFLELTKLPRLPLFNPLTLKNLAQGRGVRSMSVNTTKRPWNETTKQLSNAINLLVICWDVAPSGVLAKTKEAIYKYYYNAPFQEEIKSINTIISRDSKGRTLQDMIEELRDMNAVRKFDFCLLNEVLAKSDIKSSYG